MTKRTHRPSGVDKNLNNHIYEERSKNPHDYLLLNPEERADWEADLARIMARKLQRFQAMAGVYQTADSVLTRSSIAVSAGDFSDTEFAEVPAYNDGKTIYLNTNVLREIDDSSIVSLNGINYHEVAHILWSPRGNSEFGRKITQGQYFTAYNALEDMRIETLMTARFPSTVMSLTKAVLDYIVDSPNPDMTFALVRGRKYLPVEVRQVCANYFVMAYGSDMANKIAKIIDEYRLLTFPKDYARAYELIVAYHDLLQLPPKSGGMCGSRPLLKSGRPESGDKQNNIANRAEGMDKNSQSEDIDEQSGAGADPSGGFRTNPDGSKVQYDPTNQRKNMDESLAEAVREAIKSVMKSKQAKTEARQMRSAIREADRKNSPDGNHKVVSGKTVGIAYAQASKAFAQELNRLRIDNDPHWSIERPVGRLNVGRAMNMDINAISTVFDEWSEGRDEFDIEAVIMCDTSGSMGHIIEETMQSMWAIKRALEDIDGKVTVMGFSDNASIIYNSSERATNTYKFSYDGGGTNPLEALIEAEAILETTRRKTKLLFIITDGEWGGESECNHAIQRINDMDGAISQVVFITNQRWLEQVTPEQIQEAMTRYRHGADSISLVSTPSELVGVARSILTAL